MSDRLAGGNTLAYWQTPFDERPLHHVQARGLDVKVSVPRPVVHGQPEGDRKPLSTVESPATGTTGRCGRCGEAIREASPRALYCSAACKKAAYRQRRQRSPQTRA